MESRKISALRLRLGLSQVEFGQLFGCHSMTVSKWERGVLKPSAYQIALMGRFAQTAELNAEASRDQVKALIVGAGVIAALVWLLGGKA